jgi:hypothetical protein
MIPGSNLLGLALTVIAPQGVEWHKFASRTQNGRGDWINNYETPVALWGSWQPLDQAKYQQLGLDLAKKYFVLYVSAGVDGVERAKAGDLIIRGGRKYQVEDAANDWLDIDGWRGVMCIDIGPSA